MREKRFFVKIFTRKRLLRIGMGILGLASLLVIFIYHTTKEEPYDPNVGMVEVRSGFGDTMWVRFYEELPVFNLNVDDYVREDYFISYVGSDRTALHGVDVSEHQGEIDWSLVKADGIDFAMIRCGYRGYSEGNIYEDAYFRRNIEGALAEGIQVGIYFFSQATNTKEAAEEANFVLSLIGEYDITFPVAFDWERIDHIEDARSNSVTGKVVTDCCLRFCEIIEANGYDPAVYFYRRLGYFEYELDRLNGLRFWVGAAGEYPDFYYDHYIWQYSFTGRVSGIVSDVDLNLCFAETGSGA